MFSPYTLSMRPYRRLSLSLSDDDERDLRGLLRKGISPARVLLRALALLQLSSGLTAQAVARNLNLSAKSVRDIGWRYVQGGMERAIYEKPRPGAAALLDGMQRTGILAMLKEEPPNGHRRWTVRLIAEEAVRRRLVPSVGRETIRTLLLNSDTRPWRAKFPQPQES